MLWIYFKSPGRHIFHMKSRPFFASLLFLVLSTGLLHAQVNIQALRDELKAAPDDFKKIRLYMDASKKSASSDPAASLEFAEGALSLSNKRKSKDGLAQSLSYIGLLYINKNDCVKAKENLGKSVTLKKQLIAKKPAYKSSIAKDYRMIGHCEEQEGEDRSALKSYQNGVRYAIESKNRHEYAWGMFQVGQLQNKLGDHATAVGALDKSIEQANKLGMSNLSRSADRIRNASMAVLETRLEKEQIENQIAAVEEDFEAAKEKIEEQQEFAEVLVTEKELLEIERDAKEADLKLKAKELDRLELEKAMIEAEKAAAEAETEAQAEKQKREEERYLLMAIAGGVVSLMIIFAVVSRSRSRKKHNLALEAEKQKSEGLLYDVLPERIAKELITKNKVKPQQYKEVSILFTDFKGFTRIAANMNPDKLINDLNYAFQAFDFIVDRYGLEKIKTIGDAYMAAAGVPDPSKEHALDAVGAAMEMQAFMKDWKEDKIRKGETPWELRVGINSGPVIAGVIGKNKFAYDIWGDAVNMASRMESSGEPGKVNISARTHDLVKKVCSSTYRGKIEVKNAGAVDMYFVNDLFVKKNFNEPAPKPQKKSWWRR